MNKFYRMMVARGYWNEMGEAGGAGGSDYTPPENFSQHDTEVMQKGLDEMSDIFGGEDETSGHGDPVPKPGDDPVDPPEQVADPKETPPAETPPVDERTPEQVAADEAAAHPPTGDINQMPKSWKAGLATDYAALPESVKQEIHRREENFFKGLEARQPAVNFAVQMDEAIRPFASILQAQKATPQQAVNYLFSAYSVLTQGTPAQRIQAIQHFMKESGTTFDALSQAENLAASEQAFEDPAVKALRDELNGVKSQLTERDKAAQADLKARAEREFDDFISKNPDAAKVMDDMVPLLRAGLSLKDAYDKAIWANPVTRELKLKAEADAKAAANKKAEQEKADKAKAASRATVRTNSRGGPTAPLGTIDDTMSEVLANIKARG